MKILIITFFLLAGLQAGASAEQEAATGPCDKIIKSSCVACHYATRICQKLDKKNKRQWKATIKNMKKHGAKLTPDEEKILLQCLVKPENEMNEFCRQP